jgi:hypothetical protein
MAKVLPRFTRRGREIGHHLLHPWFEHYQSYFTFACVRNPYSRMWSHYLYRKHNGNQRPIHRAIRREGWSFARYVRWTVTNEPRMTGAKDTPQAEFLKGVRLDMTLKFEELPGCFSRLPFVPDDFVLPVVNKYSHHGGPWREAYTQELADLVYRWAIQDFVEYGYDRDACSVA